MTIFQFLNGEKPAPKLDDSNQKMREVVRSEIHDVFDQIMNTEAATDEGTETETETETEETETQENEGPANGAEI